MRSLVLVLVVGCGRVAFDPSADALTGHDEDGDGRPDSIDVCPHVVDGGADSDGDGVGDACDPYPSTAGDVLAVFSPLTAGTNPFETGPPFTQEDDGLRLVGEHLVIWNRAFTTARFEIGFEILARTANPQHQVAMGAQGPTPYYFGELNDYPPDELVSIVSYDDANGYVPLASTPHGGVHVGHGIQRLDVTAGTPATFHLVTGWDGELYEVSADTPAYTAGTGVQMAFNGLDIRLEYAVAIESP